MKRNHSLILGVVLTLTTGLVIAQEKETKEKSSPASAPRVVATSEMQWQDGPPSLPAGAKMAVLDGDPGKKGSFTLRLKMPAGYKIPAHTHPVAECVTVISGAIHLGFGEKFDESAGRELKAGDFAVIPAEAPHFAWSIGETVIQVASEGPFQRKIIEGKN